MPIMTNTEVIFFKKLQDAMPEYHIFVQVQLSRIITGNSDTVSERNFWFNRICRQSVDYVIVGDDAQTTLVAIELDDWTHNNSARQKADDKKDKALASAGIPIVRFHAERMPTTAMIRHELIQVIETYYVHIYELIFSFILLSMVMILQNHERLIMLLCR